MAPRRIADSESDSDDAPETLTLTQSKKTSQAREKALEELAVAERKSKKEKDRARDKKLKEQAAGSKKRESKGSDELEARMQRAMKDAMDEMDDGEGEDDEDDVEFDEGEQDDFEDDDKMLLDDESDEEESSASEDETPIGLGTISSLSKRNPDHLPDHLFSSAFAQQKQSQSSTAKTATSKPERRRRVRSSKSAKDVIVGSRTIRTLPNASVPIALPSAVPTAKVRKFLNRTLALAGGKSQKTWQRKPASVGVMKQRSGPAARFVRA